MRKRQKKTTPSTSGAAVLSHHALYEDVQLLVTELSARRLVLVVEDNNRIMIWSPGVKLPKPLQRAVFKHRHILIRMIADADMRVCPTPLLHKRYHKRGVCLACQRLDHSFSRSTTPIESIAS